MNFDIFASWYDFGHKLHFGKSYLDFRRKNTERAHFENYESVLEFGCGTSLQAEFLSQNHDFKKVYVGVDASFKMLYNGKQKFHPGQIYHFVQISKNIPNLPIKTGSIDVIFTSLVMHLLSPIHRKSLYAEFKRVLKPKGEIFMAEFGCPESVISKINSFFMIQLWKRIIPEEKYMISFLEGHFIGELKSQFSSVQLYGKSKNLIDHLHVKI